jgi:hypothetical protein
MKNVKMTICLVVALFSASYIKAGTWTTLDMPEADATMAFGIEGSIVIIAQFLILNGTAVLQPSLP